MSEKTGKAPTHAVYIVEEYKSGGEDRKHWINVGSAWAHQDGDGVNIEIRPGLAVSGKIVVRKPRERDEAK